MREVKKSSSEDEKPLPPSSTNQDYQLFWVPVTELISAQQSGLAKMTYQASFDLISQFQIEKAASQGIIERVVGSTSLQVAYKLGPNVDFRIPTR
ncbi:hypothetical protein EK904_013852 [Melospiza melodia maxima]|nr:hypothetical protein EK904_013852 [Melospiza melodia maxima]